MRSSFVKPVSESLLIFDDYSIIKKAKQSIMRACATEESTLPHRLLAIQRRQQLELHILLEKKGLLVPNRKSQN